ncbi:WD40 repeat-like protein, partial [Caulochytrium protostelioides]
MEIKGHQGAVYAVGFSPRGDLLASGSFDKTLRIWDVSHTQQKELHCFYGHTLNVSTLWWSPKGGEVLTGSYDQTSKIWDVETGKAKGSWNTDGFVQCVRFPE